ncbi:MAG: hypothetical protein IT374_17195 [Polyangiaceae bacterium]|nr:hypothetical protein [Polyangiaceae bacterium]
MSIARVGGPSAPAAVGGADASRAVEAAAAPGASEVAAPSPAEQVRAGSMSVAAYVELRVQEATRHLEGALDTAQLGEVREALRGEWLSEPKLRALAEAAIGRPLEDP